MKFTVIGEPENLFLPVEVSLEEMQAFMRLSQAAVSVAPEPEFKAPERFVREKEVLARLTMSRTTLWRRVHSKEFPSPRKIGPHAKAWLESEIAAYIEAQSDKAALPEPLCARHARKSETNS